MNTEETEKAEGAEARTVFLRFSVLSAPSVFMP